MSCSWTFTCRTLEQQVQATSTNASRAPAESLMGEPLVTMFALESHVKRRSGSTSQSRRPREEAVRDRPEVSLLSSRSCWRPPRGTRAGGVPAASSRSRRVGTEWQQLEFDGRRVWVAGAVARINLFHVWPTRHAWRRARAATRRAIEKSKAKPWRARWQIAIARLEAARASEAVGRAAADQARESRRIIRDRY